jgi:hypothetical protein
MPPSAKTNENPLRRLSLAATELPPPPSPSAKQVETRLRRESLAALYPPTPDGVVALARDAASNHSCVSPVHSDPSSYWTNVYLLLILPPVLTFALAHKAGLAAGEGAKSTYALLTQDPSDPDYKKAGAVTIAAHLALVPLLIATLYLSKNSPVVTYTASALLGITVIALLPMRPLAALIRTLAHWRQRAVAHVSSNVEVYVFVSCIVGIALGLYALLDHINDEMRMETFARRDPTSIQNQLAEQVLALRAELAALKASKGE